MFQDSNINEEDFDEGFPVAVSNIQEEEAT